MFLTVDKKNTVKYNNFNNNRIEQKKHRKTPFSDNTKKVVKGLAGLAVLGVASIGYAAYKKDAIATRLHEIKYIGRSIANHAVEQSNSRGKDAVDIYSKHIADMKATSLRYKMDNGMLLGKSKEAIAHIRNNLKQLELDAM